MSKRAQERMLLSQVGREIRANLRHMEQVLDAFFRDNAKRAELTSLGKWHVRQLARKLLAEGSPDVYQPNPGRPPLRLRRSALRDLKASL